MSKLAIRSELDKLAWALSVEPDALGFLDDVAAEQLRDLRVAIYELLYREDRVLFRRMAAVALGRMKAPEAAPILRKFCTDRKPSLDAVHNACGWALEQIAGERMLPPEDIIIPQRAWFLVNAD